MDHIVKTFRSGVTGRPGESHIKGYLKDGVDPPKVRPKKTAGTLELGWYWSENTGEFQMAKIAEKDRATHCYIVGASGQGKTKFLEFLIQQDIENENGLGIIDPHGDLVEDVKGFLSSHFIRLGDRKSISERVILVDPTDPEYTVVFNPLEKLVNVTVAEQACELVSAFRKIWSGSWGVRMENLMRNSLIALAEAELTLAELPSFLTKRMFRKRTLKKVKHPLAQEYFQRFDNLTDRGQVSWIEPVMNKIDAFLSDHRIRQMFSSPRSSLDLRKAMDTRKILLIKLNKGKLKDSADLLGSLFMAQIQMAVFSRSDIPQHRRVPFYLYVDEFQNFATESFSIVLSEARKYGLSLVMAHQTLAQIPNELRGIILGNTGIQVYFRLNRQDASLMAKEAFEYNGYEIKTMRLSGGTKYWSLGEEWEHYTEVLQRLPRRVCCAKHKLEGGVIILQTVEIEPAAANLATDYAGNQESPAGLRFGGKYLVAREQLADLIEQRQKSINQQIDSEIAAPEPQVKREKPDSELPASSTSSAKTASFAGSELLPDEESFLKFISRHPGSFVTKAYKTLGLSSYKGDKLKKSLIEKGLIIQEETREGRRGRLAKILSLTDMGAKAAKKLSSRGKGGEDHTELQETIKEQAEVFGWKGIIEKRIPGSMESVDVELRKADLSVAVEISATTQPEHEIQNIRKCLEAGYDYILAVCSDRKKLSRIKTEAKKGFSFKERERIRFYHLNEVKKFFANVGPKAIVSENGIVSGQILKQKEPQKHLLNSTEAAEFLGISRNTLYEWILQRKIPSIKVGRLVKFRREDLENWLEKRIQKEESYDILGQ